MRSVIRKKVRTALAERGGVVKQITPARLLGTKGNPPGAVRRRIAMMRVMEEMKRKPASRNSRKPQRSCALTVVLLYIPRTVSSSSGCGKLMQQNHPSSHASL